jgi:hypothetical protein
MAEIKTGKIISFSRSQGRGMVRMGGELISFGLGSFDSGWPVRPPKVGDEVDVRLSDTNKQVPLYVRLRTHS